LAAPLPSDTGRFRAQGAARTAEDARRGNLSERELVPRVTCTGRRTFFVALNVTSMPNSER
jgi:hypothetical protein